MKLRRHAAALSAVLLLVLSACSSPSTGSTTTGPPDGSTTTGPAGATTTQGPPPPAEPEVSIRIGIQRSSTASLIEQVMLDQGLLGQQEPALGGEVFYLANGTEILSTLLGGTTQFATGAIPPTWGAINNGECLSVLGAGTRQFFSLIGQPDFDLPHLAEGYPAVMEDLVGKKIGITVTGGTTDLLVQTLFREAGLPHDAYIAIPTGAGATSVAAFEADQVDVMMALPGVAQQIGEGNYQMVLDLLNGNPDVLTDSLIAGFITTCAYAEENPEIVGSACRAYRSAFDFVNDDANRDAVIESLTKVLGVDTAVAAEVWGAGVSETFPGWELSEDLWVLQKQFIGDIEVPNYSDYVVADC